jgi:hypothetical protein
VLEQTLTSVRAELVEAPHFLRDGKKGKQSFDKLSPNGAGLF